MAQGLLTIGTYAVYPRTQFGLLTIGGYNSTNVRTSLLTIGTYGESGVLPTYNPSLIISVARVQQNLAFPQFVIGGQGTGSQYQLFKKSTSYGFYLWRTPVYLIGTDFDVLQITFPLLVDVAAGMSIIPKLYFDNERSSSVGTTINATNNTDKLIRLTSKNFSNATHGQHSFFLELQILSSILTPISLPIYIDLDVQDT